MTSSTYVETGALGKNERPQSFTESDRVRDDDGENFGKSRVSYAFERKLALRKADRRRRAKYLMRIVVPVKLRPDDGIRFSEPLSDDARELGIRSYQKMVPNRLSLTSDPVHRESAWLSVSLPYVSILGSRP